MPYFSTTYLWLISLTARKELSIYAYNIFLISHNKIFEIPENRKF